MALYTCRSECIELLKQSDILPQKSTLLNNERICASQLIELLKKSLVAIIGSILLQGVVHIKKYSNCMQRKGKLWLGANHKVMAKYIQNELAKCKG